MIVRRVTLGSYEYQLKMVRCAKASCGKCPHGPYWYLLIRLRDGTTVLRYIGKQCPSEVSEVIAREDQT